MRVDKIQPLIIKSMTIDEDTESELESTKRRTYSFLGGRNFDSPSSASSSGLQTIDLIAGDKNKEACTRLVNLIRDPSQLCICVEGPVSGGKSLCCEVCFFLTQCRVVRWENGGNSGNGHTISGSSKTVPCKMGVDTLMSSQSLTHIEVIFVDNLHILVKEDKNSFQALLRLVASLRATCHKVNHRLRVVVTLDRKRLDSRILSQLYNKTNASVVQLDHPTRAETIDFFKKYIFPECSSELTRRLSDCVVDQSKEAKKREDIGCCGVRKAAESILDVLCNFNHDTQRNNEKKTDFITYNSGAIGLYENSHLTFETPSDVERIRCLNSSLIATCILDSYFESNGCQTLNTARGLYDIARVYAVS